MNTIQTAIKSTHSERS